MTQNAIIFEPTSLVPQQPCMLSQLGQSLTLALDEKPATSADVSIAEQILLDSIQTIHPEHLPRHDLADGDYGREVIYVDPKGRFTVLLLHWARDAKTPVHGHNAWGVVGLLDGEMGCQCFDKCQQGDKGESLAMTMDIQITRGDIAAVNPDPEGIHCLYVREGDSARSVHIYGMDLSDCPTSINVVYGD